MQQLIPQYSYFTNNSHKSEQQYNLLFYICPVETEDKFTYYCGKTTDKTMPLAGKTYYIRDQVFGVSKILYVIRSIKRNS